MAEYFTGFEQHTNNEETDEQQRKTLAATKQIGRPPRSTREMRDVKRAVDAANKEQRRLERIERGKELSRKKNVEAMKAKYRANKGEKLATMKAKYRDKRAQQVEQHIPTSHICPICKRSKPKNQQWTLVKNTSICVCQGCVRTYGKQLQRLTKLYKSLKK